MRRKLAILADAAGAALVVGAIVATYLSGDEPPVPFIVGINLAIAAVCIIRLWAWEPSIHRSPPDERFCR